MTLSPATIPMPDPLRDAALGPAVLADWRPPPRPTGAPMDGRYVRVERLTEAHADALFDANTSDANWTYLPYGPFAEREPWRDWVAEAAASEDPLFHVILDRAEARPLGVASYLRIAPEAGSIEVGHINLSPALQRTPGATEAMVLMMAWAFESGYRRYEWKCNAANRPSRDAALRLGLSFEGVFRQAAVILGRNRDTAWYAAVDGEWPALRDAVSAWLDPQNFDAEGRQRTRLSEATRPVLKAVG